MTIPECEALIAACEKAVERIGEKPKTVKDLLEKCAHKRTIFEMQLRIKKIKMANEDSSVIKLEANKEATNGNEENSQENES